MAQGKPPRREASPSPSAVDWRDAAPATADPHLLRTWLAGWCRARGAPQPTSAYGGWHVAVGLPKQIARLVFASASHGLHEAAKAIREPHVYLKTCASADDMRRRLTPGWEVQAPGFFMELSTLAARAVPASDPAILHTTDPQMLSAEIIRSGEVAAYGSVVLLDGFVIFDRINTHEAHRRQGFGRSIMTRLTGAAHERGARHGLLVATAEGRALYETIGWRLHSLYSTAVRSAAGEG